MTVPSTNTKLTDIQTEFGGSNPIQLSEYYSGGPLVPAGVVAPNGPIPSSGQISIGQFRGAVSAEFVAATGGTIATVGDYKIHTFTGPGTFTVSNAGNAAGSNAVDYMVEAGGGGGGNDCGGGGGGAGGFRESVPSPAAGTASPAAKSAGALTVTAPTGYPITVGGGGSATANGSNSVFSSITSNGGGSGGSDPGDPGGSVGSGGGAGGSPAGTGGTGNTPSQTPSQGLSGGNGSPPTPYAGGAGGGGGGVLNAGTAGYGGGGCYPAPASIGGDGAGTEIAPASYGTPGPSAPLRYYGGGGAGTVSDCHPSTPAPATARGPAVGGGGKGGKSNTAPLPERAGGTNTGGGGGGSGGYCFSTGGSGGSGIVHIRYKFQ